MAAQEAKKECVYRPALMMLEEGDQEGALALLQTISDYGNAAGYINQILYLEDQQRKDVSVLLTLGKEDSNPTQMPFSQQNKENCK